MPLTSAPMVFFKEHEITGTRIVLADITAQGVKPIGTQPANIAQTGVIEYPADEARAIKADVGVAGTVHIGVADILLGLNHQRKEVRIGLQKLFRNGVTDQLVFRLDPQSSRWTCWPR